MEFRNSYNTQNSCHLSLVFIFQLLFFYSSILTAQSQGEPFLAKPFQNNVFIKEPIVIKGAFNYSLKTIAKALYELSMIKTIWDSSSPCSNGLTAMILANEIYDNSNIKCVSSDNTMKEIENYNARRISFY